MVDRCPTCGKPRGPTALERFESYARDVYPFDFHITAIAAYTDTALATAYNTASRLVALGKLQRVDHGRYVLAREVANG